MNARTTARRRAEIIRLLEQEGAVEGSALAARFGVSAPTVRRDLEWLEREGLAHRVRGGAVAAGRDEHDAVQLRLAQAAAELVSDGETVFIGPGRATEELACVLSDCRRLTVVTNSLAVARQIAERSQHTLILTGGQLERESQGLSGQLAHLALAHLRAERVFFEPDGISALNGLTSDSLACADLARALLDTGAEFVALVAPERVGRAAAASIGPATEASVVITAREADTAPLWDLTELGVRVILA